MATEILNPQVHASGLLDVFLMGISKSITERALSGVIGNGNLKSGAIKGITGGLIYNKAGKYGNIVSGGLIIDGVEDIISSVMNKQTQATEAGAVDW